MTGFVLLWQKTLLSSLWVNESKETRLLFMTMLMLKNSDGVIQGSVVGLADAAKITPDECRESLKDLLAPDPDDSSKVDDGRRIREIPGGWQIVNSDAYRFSTEAKRAFWAQQKAEQRAKEEVKAKAKEAFVGEFEKEKKKRKKSVVQEAKDEGQKAGAKSAIGEGLAEAMVRVEDKMAAEQDAKVVEEMMAKSPVGNGGLNPAAQADIERYNRENRKV